MTSSTRRTVRLGLLFCAPAILGLLCLTLYPVLASFYWSFCDYRVLLPPKFIGGGNYAHLIYDDIFWTSLWNTVYFAVFSIPLGIVAAFVLALLLNQKVRGQALYRTCFYVPSVVPLVASSVLWIWLFNPQAGPINDLLRHLGIANPPGWFSDPAWSKPAIILWSVWGVGGAMIIFLAGLQDVPQELYEAAEVDGARAWQRVIHVTLPFLSPHILFVVIMGLIGSFQFFTPAYVMTSGHGGPVDSTLFYSFYLFLAGFADFKMGYACAMAWILLLIVLGATLLVFKSSARHLYYAGGEGGDGP